VALFPDAPAALAGISAGDVIVSFNGHAITNNVSLTVAVRAAHPSERVTVVLYRRALRMVISIVLGAKPAPESGLS
jgi:S1-C subfamily serine protease